MCFYTFSLRSCFSAPFSSERAGQNRKTFKVYVLILIYFRNLILWEDCLNLSSKLLLCCCWVLADQPLLERHISGQSAHVVRVCCASDVAMLRFQLYDHETRDVGGQKVSKFH